MMMVVIAVVMMARDVDARHVVMAVVVMVARPRMIMTMMMMSPMLDLRHHPGRALLNRCGDTRRERGSGLRLRGRRHDNEQSTDCEQAEKFFDEHQCSPSGGV
jgi:hypothetical protein